jgi:endo-1,4-beta-mannosidase
VTSKYRLLFFALAMFLFTGGCAAGNTPVESLSTASSCIGAEIQSTLLDYSPSLMDEFVTLRDGRFAIGDAIFSARGVNYYPARFPWRRFLTESNLDAIRQELLLLRATGFNSLRLFLWNAALFTCDAGEMYPNDDAFERLDAIIQEAAAQGFRLIVTLNDLPDETIYTNPAYLQAQTQFIVERYHDEAAILAWDLRNEGDIDYGANDALGRGKFAKADVLDWLKQTAEQVSRLDNNHLITAGWLKDSGATADDVDFLSLHHWEDAGKLRDRIAGMREADKPILLEEFGYSTMRMSPEDQSRTIAEVIGASDEENLLGWMIWAAFDFPLDATCVRPACPSQDNAEHHFGLWFPDYTPKPAVEMLLAR